jgi:hypothetical protein
MGGRRLRIESRPSSVPRARDGGSVRLAWKANARAVNALSEETHAVGRRQPFRRADENASKAGLSNPLDLH